MGAHRFILAVAVATLAACIPGAVDDAEPPRLLVSAATSIADALRAAADEYERTGGATVVLNVGGSDTLATQLLAGARADLFVSADDRQMNRVESGGRILSSTRVDLLTNQLAIVATHDQLSLISGVEDLQSPQIRRIAMGDPDAVPAGVYAKQYLQSVGLWDTVRSKVVSTRNVRAALAAVEAGHADVGFVYRTDLAVAKSVGMAFAIPMNDGPRILYPAAVAADTVNESAARHFLAFLRGPEAQQLFEGAGFIQLAGPVG